MWHLFGSLSMGCILLVSSAYAQPPLALDEAEQIALERDPATRAIAARAEALRSQAVAEGQLPDPKLRLGFENVPTKPLSLSAEPMTQFTVGLMQEFSRGDSRKLRTQQSLAQATGEEARAQERRLQLLRNARRAWLESWYQQQALETVRASRDLFARLVEITEAQYAAGRDNQQTVLEARVELARIADRESAVQTSLDAARADLARWIGDDGQRPLSRDGIVLPAIESLAALDGRLPQHPALGGDNAEILVAQKEGELSRQEYRPGFALDIAYSKRFGQENGVPRSDMVSAMIEMELPLFRGNRQDKRVAASDRRAEAAQYARDDRLRELRAQLQTNYTNWLHLGERLERYRRDLMPQAALNATAADRAYRNRTAEFATLVRAQLSDLDARLEALRMETDRAQAQAELAYFAGEPL